MYHLASTDIFEGIDYADKDKDTYIPEEDKDYILQEDPHFVEKESDISSSASEGDSGASSEEDVDVAEMEIETIKLFNDLDKPAQGKGLVYDGRFGVFFCRNLWEIYCLQIFVKLPI